MLLVFRPESEKQGSSRERGLVERERERETKPPKLNVLNGESGLVQRTILKGTILKGTILKKTILKRKILKRKQVKRLTKALQNLEPRRSFDDPNGAWQNIIYNSALCWLFWGKGEL